MQPESEATKGSAWAVEYQALSGAEIWEPGSVAISPLVQNAPGSPVRINQD